MRSLFCLLILSLALVGRISAEEATPSTDPFTSPDIPEVAESEFEDAAVNEMMIQETPLEIAEADEYEIAQADEDHDGDRDGAPLGAAYLATLTAPPKQRLATRTIDLGIETDGLKLEAAPDSPALEALPIQYLPRQILAKRHAPRLGLMRLPQKVSQAKEHRPVRMLAPLAPHKRAPQYRQQLIKQEVVQPVVQIQPMLHQRVLTRTIHQPTMQKQPVIQRIITQPILRRVIREQPITQQQMTYQNIVKTRQVKKPEVREELKVERETKPQETVEEKGAPFPRLTQPPKKHD